MTGSIVQSIGLIVLKEPWSVRLLFFVCDRACGMLYQSVGL